MAVSSTTRRKGDGRGREGGRKKGTPNKVSRPMRELLANFCEEKFKDFCEAFNNIESPRDKCRIYLEAQAFVTPKLSSVDFKGDVSRRSFQDELDELAGKDLLLPTDDSQAGNE